MQSRATTVAAYLSSLPPDRRNAIERVRKLVLDNLDPDFEEGMQYGMIGYYVPHRVYPAGYHCDPKQPLPFAALASQKNYMSLYMMSVYGEGPHWDGFREAWARTGKKLDMGKCCIRFKRAEDLALDVIADTIRRTSAADYVAHYESVRPPVRGANKQTTRDAGRSGANAAATRPKPAAKKQVKKAARKTSPRTAAAKQSASRKKTPAGRAARPRR